MSSEIPLGKREDLHLEFKSVEALEKPEIVGREVAAMLNAEGGEVWIGLRDQDGRAVEIQPVPDPDRASDALRDSLIDRLEPSPQPRELRVESVPIDGGGSLLRVIVDPVEERKPYALLKSGGWHFQMRIGSRIRRMSREEIFGSRKSGGGGEEELGAVVKRVLREREEFQTSAGEELWLRILPVRDLELDLQSLPLVELLENPSKSGNRYTGWHFARVSPTGVHLGREKLFWSYGQKTFEAEVGADGGMRFVLSLQSLRLRGEEREFHPWSLLEYPISAFRLASKIYAANAEIRPEVVSDLGVFGIQSWKLGRGSSIFGEFSKSDEYPSREYTEGRDLVWSRPLVFDYQKVIAEPDRCGFRHVRRVYEAFGYPERLIPREYDRKTGRLVFND